MLGLLARILIGCAISLYFFPFALTFLPSGANTKMTMAVVGTVLFAFDCIKSRRVNTDRSFLGAVILVVLFSLSCLVAVDVNNTQDYSYAMYFVSFFTWLGGAYTVCWLLRLYYHEVNFRILTIYLAWVCFIQCILAILIDRVAVFRIFIDSFVIQGQDFLTDVGRLYGIGASLDTAGIRFAVVLVMIAALIAKDEKIQSKLKFVIMLMVMFFTIVIIGNMISRTTIIGAAAALVYWFLATGLWRLVIKSRFFTFHRVFFTILLVGVIISVIFYNIDGNFRSNFTFAFEGFFNLVEKGKWRTDSTDKLNTVMWVWPQDIRSWIIGTGLFDNFIYSTDIGYCRFILYCGITGFSLFALFFLYNAYIFGSSYLLYADFFLVLGGLTFVIWLKVATDLFFIYALFYCLDYISVHKSKDLLRRRLSTSQHY